jgi:type IV pilus assembly protein PilA
VAIIGILAAVAVPQYNNYVADAQKETILSAANGYKTAVGICSQKTGGLSGCSTGSSSDLPAAIVTGDGHESIDALSVSDGKIDVKGHSDLGGGQYCLTPTVTGGVIKWTEDTGACS